MAYHLASRAPPTGVTFVWALSNRQLNCLSVLCDRWLCARVHPIGVIIVSACLSWDRLNFVFDSCICGPEIKKSSLIKSYVPYGIVIRTWIVKCKQKKDLNLPLKLQHKFVTIQSFLRYLVLISRRVFRVHLTLNSLQCLLRTKNKTKLNCNILITFIHT